MKPILKKLFFILALSGAYQLQAQPCTPDNTILASQGTFPDVIGEAHINVAYTQIIQYKAAKDTNVFYAPLNTTVAVRIDSLRITHVIGLPAGIAYQCNPGSCMIEGGAVGCVLLSGIPTEAGGHPLKVVIRTSAKIVGTPPFPDIPQTSIDTNTHYSLFVNWPTGLMQMVDAEKVKLYPNPAHSFMYVEGDFSKEKNVHITVYDLAGRSLMDQPLQVYAYQNKVDISALPKGIYQVSVRSDEKIRYQKLVIE